MIRSLYLYRTRARRTRLTAPGPGPITRRDWGPICKKLLENKRVILNTDGARSYRMGINRARHVPGVIHNYVVHKCKKTRVGVVRPRYVSLFRNVLPSGDVIYTKAGTQVIDRVWRALRENCKHCPISRQPAFTAKVRTAQWRYWNTGCDLMVALGRDLQSQFFY